jgi:phosphate transport system substrate-binding protein
MTAGSIALAYNLPNGPAELKLTRSALLGIAHGDIDNWNDPALVDANPGSSLPDLPISWIRRAEGSGTTYAFTNHLHAVDPERWPASLRGKTVDWPKGVGAKGNNGVAALIQQTPGAIGYIESGYAELTGLPTAAVQNKAGRFVQPTAASSLAALENAKIPDDLIIWVTDPEGPDAYPIVTYTWIIAYRRYRDPRRLDALKAVLRYGATEGQQYSADLGYVPLPQNVAAKVLAKLDSMTTSDDGR